MDINSVKLTEIKDMVNMLKKTTSIIALIQGNIELDKHGTSLEDVSNSLFLVWDKQIEYISAIEKLLNIV